MLCKYTYAVFSQVFMKFQCLKIKTRVGAAFKTNLSVYVCTI